MRLQMLRDEWGLSAEDRRTVFILAGRLTRWKGQGMIIDAAARLKAEGGPQPLILLVGADQDRHAYRREIETAIARHGLGETVRLLGHCDDMPAAYVFADFALAPSLKPEPFGRTAVEPQAMARPALAADHGAARETVEDGRTGWLVEPGEPAAWAEALRWAMALTPSARAAMGQAAMERARRLYSVDAMTAATLKIYAQLVEGGR
jgi:glycosyltransferase involved in cell wall biosynthesis